jgi:hypothetical protein
MKCAHCGAATDVADTRTRQYGVYRRRKCPNCGFRFSTLEIRLAEQDMEEAALKNGRDIDGEAFESWLTVIATTLPVQVTDDLDLRALRRWFEEGMALDEALARIRQMAELKSP